MLEKSGRIQLDPGAQQAISEQFPAGRGQGLTATLSVQIPKDGNAANDRASTHAVMR